MMPLESRQPKYNQQLACPAYSRHDTNKINEMQTRHRPGCPEGAQNRAFAFDCQVSSWSSDSHSVMPVIQSLVRLAMPVVGFSYRGRIFLLTMASHNTTLEYLTTTRIGEKGQLTVPKQFRQDLGLGTGAPFAVLRLGDGLILLPEQRRFEELCQQVSSSLTAARLTSEDLIATLPEARNRVYKRQYGEKPSRNVLPRRSRNQRGK
jgi:AbrB family looped-hinge helix DNA binding protein